MRDVVRAHRHRNVFGLKKDLITPCAAFAACATGFGTAKRLAQVTHVLTVHKAHARFDGSGHAMGFAQVFGPHIARSTVLNVVGLADGIGFVGEWNQTRHGTENFFLRNAHAVVHIGKHGGAHKVAFLQMRWQVWRV